MSDLILPGDNILLPPEEVARRLQLRVEEMDRALDAAARVIANQEQTIENLRRALSARNGSVAGDGLTPQATARDGAREGEAARLSRRIRHANVTRRSAVPFSCSYPSCGVRTPHGHRSFGPRVPVKSPRRRAARRGTTRPASEPPRATGQSAASCTPRIAPIGSDRASRSATTAIALSFACAIAVPTFAVGVWIYRRLRSAGSPRDRGASSP